MGSVLRCQGQTFGPIEMVIFDKDGTLAHSASYLQQLGRSRTQRLESYVPGIQAPLLKAFGFDKTGTLHPQGLLAVGSRYENEISAATYIAETGHHWTESMALAKSAFEEADTTLPSKASTTPIIDGVRDLVRSLHAAHIRLGMVSADTTENVVNFAQQYEMTNYFACLAGVDTVDKSDPKACRIFFQQYDMAPANILVIGDSGSDVRLAQSLGAQCIGVTWGWDMDFSIPGADAIANYPTDIHIMAS